MDLYAYSKIEDLGKILEVNKIDIPRLRGLRLMKEDEKVSEKEIQEMIENEKKQAVINWLQQHSENVWDSRYEKKRHKAFIYGINEWGERGPVDYDFSKIHGKDRKFLKYKFKKIEKAYREQYEMFNSFVGKDVLMVHARQGGWNRPYYPIDTTHPMYLCDVDDAWDCTYCDIYYDLTKGVKCETDSQGTSKE